MRFLADMKVPVSVVEQLRHLGHDAIHLHDHNLQKLTDQEVFHKTLAEDRILLTFDLDFSEIVAFSGNREVGTIVFRLRNTRAGHVMERLEKVLAESSEALKKGAIVNVEEHRHRVRSLPIAT